MDLRAPRLRPLGVGDLLDEMTRLYRNHFGLLAGIAAIVLVPLYLVYDLVQIFWPGGPSGPIDAPAFSLLYYLIYLAFVIAWLIALVLGSMAVNMAITRAVADIYMGSGPTIGGSYSASLQRLLPAIGLSLLIVIALGLLTITVIGIPFAVYLGVCWMLSFQVLLLEGTGIRASLGRSRALVRGHWWRVLGIAILLGIIGWVVNLVLSLPSAVLGGVGVFVGGGIGSSLLRLVGAIFGVAGSVLAAPIWFCGAVLLYYDLRVRKEGFDLELMARELGAASETDPAAE